MNESSITKRFQKIFHYYSFNNAIKIIFYYCLHSFLLKFITPSSSSLVKVNGMQMKILPGDKGISTELLIFKEHEPLTTQLIKNELKEGMICLDVGSNIGYYVLLEAKFVGKSGKVIAIEPSFHNFKILEENIRLQNFTNIEVHHFACGDSDGHANFLTTDRSNWSRIDENYFEFSPPTKSVSSEKIEMKKIDSFIEQKEIDRLDIIRMDVEGYEFKILDGMINTLKKFKPTIIMEIHLARMGVSNTKELLQKLNDLSYEANFFIPRNLDYSLISSTKQIKKFSISELCQKMDQDLLPNAFSLVLKPNF